VLVLVLRQPSPIYGTFFVALLLAAMILSFRPPKRRLGRGNPASNRVK
jgi:hypothetical protein